MSALLLWLHVRVPLLIVALLAVGSVTVQWKMASFHDVCYSHPFSYIYGTSSNVFNFINLAKSKKKVKILLALPKNSLWWSLLPPGGTRPRMWEDTGMRSQWPVLGRHRRLTHAYHLCRKVQTLIISWCSSSLVFMDVMPQFMVFGWMVPLPGYELVATALVNIAGLLQSLQCSLFTYQWEADLLCIFNFKYLNQFAFIY